MKKKDTRIKVYLNNKQLGDYPNRNKAASYAGGKYLKYVDSDDYIYPKGLELMVEAMERFPEAAWGICSLAQNAYVNKPFPFALSPSEAYTYNYLGPGSIFDTTPLCSIIKREAFNSQGGFAPLRMVGDLELWHRLGQKYCVVLMMEGLVWYRVHEDREMKDFQLYSTLYEQIRINYLLHKNCPLSGEQVKQILRKRGTGHFHLFAYHLMKGNFRYSKQYSRLVLFNYSKYVQSILKGWGKTSIA